MKKQSTAWRSTPSGVASYQKVRAAAQHQANLLGFDFGVEANDLLKQWQFFMLPMKANRYGFETRCEVVSCENLEKCQKGHGP